MQTKTQLIVTYWTLEHWHWMSSMAQIVGIKRGKKLKVYERWGILVRRWIKDGQPRVPMLDVCPQDSYVFQAPLETPLWNELVRACCNLSIEREMLLSVAVLVRSILDYYMHKESSDGFAHRCFEDLPAEPDNPEAPLQGVAGLGRIHQGRNADSGMESAL
jgi:hypothetical protein